MNNIVEHIDYLVRRHECVVLPSWGAFIAHHRPAYFDIERGKMFPPKREISFNSSVDHSDGLLVASIARRQGISFEKASIIVSREIESMKHQLEHDGEIALGNIGKFTYQKGLAPTFEPSNKYHASASSFMQPLEIMPVVNIAQENAIRQRIKSNKARSRRRRFALQTAKFAAAIAVVATITVSLINFGNYSRNDNLATVTPMPSTTQCSTQTALVPVADNTEPTLYIPVPTEKPVTVAHQIDTTAIAQRIEAPKATEAKETVTAAPTATELRSNDTDSYCLVVASLPTEELAQKFIAEAGDSNLGILAKDGKYRIYAATANSKDDVLRQKSAEPIASKYPDAWVCRR